jgi:2-C-methyl-D-erythritol 4-phosphate cytidylyltransferase
VLIVEGRADNLKITRQEDLYIASAIMKSQEVK